MESNWGMTSNNRRDDYGQQHRYNTTDTPAHLRRNSSLTNSNSNNIINPCKLCCQCCCMCPVICCLSGPMLKRLRTFGFGSLPLVVIMIMILYSVSDKKTTWTFNPGEMRQLSVNMFTESVDLSCDDVSSGCFRVYKFSNPKCPPLSGPKFISEDSSDMTLGPGDYQYDYFYLTEGSRITLSVEQHYGASNVYILDGPHVIDQLNSYDFHFLHSVARQAYVNAENGSSTDNKNAQKTLHYTAKESMTYVLLYENASYGDGNLSARHTIEHTTYDLTGKEPYCEFGHDTCQVRTVGGDNRACILVQANDDTDQDVAIDIVGVRNWGFILLVSSLPLLLEWIWHLKVGATNGCKSCSPSLSSPSKMTSDEYEAIGDDLETSVEEQTSLEAKTIPVATTYDSIPVVPIENIVPMAPPPL